MAKNVLDWEEAYAYRQGKGSRWHRERRSASNKMELLKSEIGDAFVWHGVDNEPEIARYFSAAVHWLCNCFRREHLRWPGPGKWGDGRIANVVRGMMIAIDELTIPPSILDLAERAIPLMREDCRAEKIADTLGTDVQTAENLERLPIKLCLQDALSQNSQGGTKLTKVQFEVARRLVAGRQNASIAKELGLRQDQRIAKEPDPAKKERIAERLGIRVDPVDQIVTAVLRKQCLSRVRRARNESREHQRWIELAEADMPVDKIAESCGVEDREGKTGGERVTELLERVVRLETLHNLKQHGKERVRWHALLPLAVAGHKSEWQEQERRDLLAMARILVGIKRSARSRVEVRRAYANGMAELQEAWEGDAACRMAASCLEWHDGEALRCREECGFPETYGEWGNCKELVNPHPDDDEPDGRDTMASAPALDAFRISRSRLKVLERCETRAGRDYGAVARRFLSTQLQRVMQWWKDPGVSIAEEAKHILEDIEFDDAVQTLRAGARIDSDFRYAGSRV